MAATRTRTRAAPSSNGNAAQAAGTVASAARNARGPLIAAAAATAGLAGGLALGARRASKAKGLGAVVVRAAEGLSRAGDTRDDIRQIREQLELANRRSPLEVVLDGLTHRRGAHRHEG